MEDGDAAEHLHPPHHAHVEAGGEHMLPAGPEVVVPDMHGDVREDPAVRPPWLQNRAELLGQTP